MDTPIFTPAACEGTTTLFGVPYFDEGTAYLTQSGQLYSEATAAAHGRVYCFGPTFRAEKSKTRRHLTEFWMVEPEMAFAHLEDAIGAGGGARLSGRGRAGAGHAEGGAEVPGAGRSAKLENVRPPFPRLHYDDAIKLIESKGSTTEWGSDFGGTDETVIAEAHDRPVVVHRFPSAIKAFYMAPDPERPELSLSADILAPEGYGEIVGGGERLAEHDLLLRRIREHELPEEAFRWYLRPARSTAAFPHAGLRHGHRAGRDVDLRHRAPARDDRLPAHAVSDIPLGSLRDGRAGPSTAPRCRGPVDFQSGEQAILTAAAVRSEDVPR